VNMALKGYVTAVDLEVYAVAYGSSGRAGHPW
jgi:hypothetical protein